MLRIETFASSPSLDTCLQSSFLLSSVNGGIGKRITDPSFIGLSPRLASTILFSISLILYLYEVMKVH